jgi:hypothetical protein
MYGFQFFAEIVKATIDFLMRYKAFKIETHKVIFCDFLNKIVGPLTVAIGKR